MTEPLDLGPWLRQQRELRSWTRTGMARRLIRDVHGAALTARIRQIDVAQDSKILELGQFPADTASFARICVRFADSTTNANRSKPSLRT
jgi:hypothetical protein